MPNKQCV